MFPVAFDGLHCTANDLHKKKAVAQAKRFRLEDDLQRHKSPLFIEEACPRKRIARWCISNHSLTIQPREPRYPKNLAVKMPPPNIAMTVMMLEIEKLDIPLIP